MKKSKNFKKTFSLNQKGQGTAEYVLLLAIVVGVLVIFGPQLKGKMKDQWEKISGQIDQTVAE